MKEKVNKTIVILIVILIGATLYIFSPSVEGVSYTQHSSRSKNSLWIDVNTKRGLFSGRESFLEFKRARYLLTFAVKSDVYNENDTEITIHGMGHDGWTIKPKHSLVRITDNPPWEITVRVDVDDKRIPKVINGTYRLRQTESGSPYYELKK